MKYDVIVEDVVVAYGVTMEEASRLGLLQVGTTLIPV